MREQRQYQSYLKNPRPRRMLVDERLHDSNQLLRMPTQFQPREGELRRSDQKRRGPPSSFQQTPTYDIQQASLPCPPIPLSKVYQQNMLEIADFDRLGLGHNSLLQMPHADGQQ